MDARGIGPAAQDKDGNQVRPQGDTAIKFCSLGAMWKVTGGLFFCMAITEKFARYVKFQEDHDCTNIAEFNDSHSHAEVIAMWQWVAKELQIELPA